MSFHLVIFCIRQRQQILEWRGLLMTKKAVAGKKVPRQKLRDRHRQKDLAFC